MPVTRSDKVKPRLRVCHPMNTGGSTWLRESDLVFVGKKPFVVLNWSPSRKDTGEVLIPLNSKMLKHDRDEAVYRYEGEISEPGAS